jgi:hypothetical protein
MSLLQLVISGFLQGTSLLKHNLYPEILRQSRSCFNLALLDALVSAASLNFTVYSSG